MGRGRIWLAMLMAGTAMAALTACQHMDSRATDDGMASAKPATETATATENLSTEAETTVDGTETVAPPPDVHGAVRFR